MASMAMVDNYSSPDYGQHLPHRKPLPQSAAQNVAAVRSNPSYPSALAPQQLQQQPSHAHTRTSSSNIFPINTMPTANQATGQARRTLSNATTSTTHSSTSSGNPTQGNLGRTPSGRSSIMSSNGPLSYVALMRKQKATVWCDRAQHEDPRLLAAQRAARKRAQLEFAGGHQTQVRTSTGSSGMNTSVRSKIRHHGVPKATPYQPANLSGSGVPMRLSATEVDDELASDDEQGSQWTSGPAGYGNNHHKRSGSGRSSLGSMGARNSYAGVPRINSTSSTPPNHTGNSSPATRSEDNLDLVEEETPVPQQYGQAPDYFARSSNGSRENSFGEVKQLPGGLERPPVERNKTEELRRRGSVDDRTTTMSGNTLRLFVANPDLD